MVALQLSCRRVQFALQRPFHNSLQSWDSREALHVRLVDTRGMDGNGEAAPLPGYSADDLVSCERALRAISAHELDQIASSGVREGLRYIEAALPLEAAAARFALETAFLDWVSKQRGEPLWRLLGEVFELATHAAPPLPLCAVLPEGDPDAALRHARGLFERGVRTFKLKIGPGVLGPDQECVLRALRAELGDRVELRLDANRSLRRSDLGATLARLAAFRPEFVEEPVLDPAPRELSSAPVDFALDESLANATPDTLAALRALPTCRALVLKPTLLGGFTRCFELARGARACSKDVVVSHCIEGPLGFAACAQLAFALRGEAAAGLWPLPHQLRDAGARGIEIDAFGMQAPMAPGLGASA